MSRRWFAICFLLALGLLTPCTRAADFTVFIYDYYFLPTNLTVAPGDTVTWNNKGLQPHDSTASNQLWASDLLYNDEEFFSFTFAANGEYPYICLSHISDYPQQTGLVVVASINLPPNAQVTSPTNGASFLAPAFFPFRASATDADGLVTNVEFFVNGTSVGAAAGPQFSVNVSGLGAGNHALTALATDDRGATNLSPPVNITVQVPPKFPLTLTVLPVGGGTVTASPPPPGEGYDAGTVVTLTAAAAEGFAFSDWSGAVSTAQNPITVTMDAAQSVTANFSINQIPPRRLTLATNPPAGGSIQVDPAPNAAGGAYVDGTVVTLTARPAPGYVFTNWSGAVSATSALIAVTMDADKTVTAGFTEFAGASFTLTLQTNPPGAGSITVLPPPNGFNGTYFAGTVVTLRALALGANEFVNWAGDAGGVSNVTTVLLDGNKSVLANFAPIAPPTVTLSLAVSPANGGLVLAAPPFNTSGVYPVGTTVALAAQPAPGYRFANWVGAVSSTNNPLLLLLDADKQITAVFAPLPPLDFKIVGGAYAGLLVDERETNYTTSGFISLRVSKTGAYHGSSVIGGISQPIAGQFDRFGYAPLVARRATLSGSLQIDGARQRMTGVLTDGRKFPEILLYRTTPTNAPPAAADYALSFAAQAPVATLGAAEMKVLPSRMVRLRGTLGDGTRFTSRAFLTPDARVPFFVRLYQGRGAVLGWLEVAPDGSVLGAVRWFRPGDSRQWHYPEGFALKISVTGSRAE